VGDDSDVSNAWIQIENSSGLQIAAYYYFTMAEELVPNNVTTLGLAGVT
jgi:hypothetical protein